MHTITVSVMTRWKGTYSNMLSTPFTLSILQHSRSAAMKPASSLSRKSLETPNELAIDERLTCEADRRPVGQHLMCENECAMKFGCN